MRPLAAIVAWSVIVLGLLFFDPGFVQGPSCMRLVGRSADCEAQAAAWNDAFWWQHTFPLFALIAAGYVAIGLVVLIGGRRRRKRGGRVVSDG